MNSKIFYTHYLMSTLIEKFVLDIKHGIYFTEHNIHCLICFIYTSSGQLSHKVNVFFMKIKI